MGLMCTEENHINLSAIFPTCLVESISIFIFLVKIEQIDHSKLSDDKSLLQKALLLDGFRPIIFKLCGSNFKLKVSIF